MLLPVLLALLALQEPEAPTQEERRENAELLLQKLANPLAALASLSLINDFEYHVGPERDGDRIQLALQATLPLKLADQWFLISRSTLPFVYQEELLPGSGSQMGFSDLTETLYLVSVEPSRRGWLWGAGPVLRVPVASNDLLNTGKYSAGPSVAFVRQQDDFTIGIGATQLWSFAGEEDRKDVQAGILEPFVTYRTEGLWNLTLRAPSTYDFKSHQWAVPIALLVEKLVSFQKFPVTLSFGLRYWADSPENGPHDLGFRFGVTIVFPN